MKTRTAPVILFLVLTVVLNVASASPLLELVSPGGLSRHHATGSTSCADCHEPGNKSAQGRLCVACHDSVGDDIEAGTGLHGRHSMAAVDRCNACHTEHQGPQANIRGLLPDTFDHGVTDFPLAGSHRGIECADCHEPDQPRGEAETNCDGCHRSPHKEPPAGECDSCHGVDRWGEITFVHGVDYELTGAHTTVRCISCHQLANFERIGRRCVDCHELTSPHAGLFGDECGDCHRQTAFDDAPFDHGEATGYPLAGGHRIADCHACHRFDDRSLPAPEQCGRCHAAADVHTGSHGTDCGGCHDVSSWAIERFDHAGMSGFTLRGAHVALPCTLCHAGGVEVELPTDCVGCHRLRDVHDASVGEACGECHEESGWRAVAFNHDDATRYPLDGGHSSLDCQACHAAGRKWPGPPPCIDCHRADDVHGGGDSDCARCHLEDGWQSAARFSHEFTALPLLGMHGLALCESCHADKAYSPTPSSCAECHGDRDPHRNNYEAGCEECHNPNAWSSWRFDHRSVTGFALLDRHQQLSCGACHDRARPLRSRDAACLACHRKDDIHRGRFGADCGRCHTAADFRDVNVGSYGRGAGLSNP